MSDDLRELAERKWRHDVRGSLNALMLNAAVLDRSDDDATLVATLDYVIDAALAVDELIGRREGWCAPPSPLPAAA